MVLYSVQNHKTMMQAGIHLAKHLHVEGYYIAFTAATTVSQAYTTVVETE